MDMCGSVGGRKADRNERSYHKLGYRARGQGAEADIKAATATLFNTIPMLIRCTLSLWTLTPLRRE